MLCATLESGKKECVSGDEQSAGNTGLVDVPVFGNKLEDLEVSLQFFKEETGIYPMNLTVPPPNDQGYTYKVTNNRLGYELCATTTAGVYMCVNEKGERLP